MKVRLTVTLEVDAEAWANEYGLDKDEVRKDVRASIETSVIDGYPGTFFKNVKVQ